MALIDIEIAGPDLDRACFDHPPLPADATASDGPANDCILDKIDQFTAELARPATDPEERVVALKFLLHLIGEFASSILVHFTIRNRGPSTYARRVSSSVRQSRSAISCSEYPRDST